MLLTAVAIDALVAFLFLSASITMGGPMFLEPPSFPWLVPAIGIGLNVIGLGWMVRLYRTDPEAGRSSWRATRR